MLFNQCKTDYSVRFCLQVATMPAPQGMFILLYVAHQA